MIFRTGQFNFDFPRPAMVMGVLNVTPDSFSDGGRFASTDAAVQRGLELAAQGAEIIDIGGESTRPKATPVSAAEELRRVIPVITELAGKTKVALSIDTMKPAVARAAVEAGASIINDIAANRMDDAMAKVVAETGAGYILMHMQGTPQIMQVNPVYTDVVTEVGKFLEERLSALTAAGVHREQVALDVGIGFGKNLEHNLLLLAGLRHFTKWERPLVLGVSRKSFMNSLLHAPVENRLAGSLAGACWGVGHGANIIRAHDVAETIQAVRLTEALLTR